MKKVQKRIILSRLCLYTVGTPGKVSGFHRTIKPELRVPTGSTYQDLGQWMQCLSINWRKLTAQKEVQKSKFFESFWKCLNTLTENSNNLQPNDVTCASWCIVREKTEQLTHTRVWKSCKKRVFCLLLIYIHTKAKQCTSLGAQIGAQFRVPTCVQDPLAYIEPDPTPEWQVRATRVFLQIPRKFKNCCTRLLFAPSNS